MLDELDREELQAETGFGTGLRAHIRGRHADEAQALAAEAKRLADQKAELERHLDVRDLLRRRAEQEVERLWRTFDEALEATRAGGEPDYEVRLSAARALLAEAYAAPGEGTSDADELPDELAALRERKVQLR